MDKKDKITLITYSVCILLLILFFGLIRIGTFMEESPAKALFITGIAILVINSIINIFFKSKENKKTTKR